MEADRLEKEIKIQDLIQTLVKEENKLKQIKAKRDSVKKQVSFSYCGILC